jgi:hypothetical protein
MKGQDKYNCFYSFLINYILYEILLYSTFQLPSNWATVIFFNFICFEFFLPFIWDLLLYYIGKILCVYFTRGFCMFSCSHDAIYLSLASECRISLNIFCKTHPNWILGLRCQANILPNYRWTVFTKLLGILND